MIVIKILQHKLQMLIIKYVDESHVSSSGSKKDVFRYLMEGIDENKKQHSSCWNC